MTDDQVAHLTAILEGIDAADAGIAEALGLVAGLESAAAEASESFERARRAKRTADQAYQLNAARLGRLQFERNRLNTELDQLRTAAYRAENIDPLKLEEFERSFDTDAYRRGPADAIGWMS